MADEPGAPAPDAPTSTSTSTSVNVPVTLTPSVAAPPNGNGHMRNWLIAFLGIVLILETLSQTSLAHLLLWRPPRKAAYEPILEFIKQGVQVKTMLISGLLGALTQRALDAIAGKK